MTAASLAILADLAPPTSTSDWNTSLVSWLAVIAMAVLYIMEKMQNLRRKPSIDVDVEKLRAELASIHNMALQVRQDVERIPRHDGDLARINTTLAGVVERLDKIDERLEAGDERIAKLREKESGNAAAISTMKADVHDTKVMVTALSARGARRSHD